MAGYENPSLRVKRERAEQDRRRREGKRRSPTGQIIETYRPDTLGGAAYELIGKGAGAVSRLLGGSDDTNFTVRRRGETLARDVGEMILAPEELERSVRRVSRGEGDAMDYGMLGLSVVPAVGRKGVRSAVSSLKSTARKAMPKRAAKAAAKPAAKPAKKAVEKPLKVSRDIPREKVFSATTEETPGASTKHRPDILKGDLGVRDRYGKEASWSRPSPEGDYDVLYAAQGIPQRPVEEAAGAYLNSEGVLEMNPVRVIQPYVGDEPSADMLQRISATENLRGLIDAQEAMAGNMPIADASGADSWLYSMGRQPYFGEMSETAHALSGGPYGMAPTSRGATLMSFDGSTPPSTMLEELSRIYPEARVEPVRNAGFFEPAMQIRDPAIDDTRATIPFSGEATMQTLQRLADAPSDLGMDLAMSPEVRDVIRAKLARDEGMFNVREDLQNTRRFFADANWQDALELIRRGVPPAAALGSLGYSATAFAAPQGD